MTTATEARDAVISTIRTAWLASGTTSSIALFFDNVDQDPVGEDAEGRPLPWGRVTVRTVASDQETLGGPGVGKYLTEGVFQVDVFTAAGDGHTLADAIVEVIKAATRGVQVGSLWFFGVGARELGQEGGWSRQAVTGGFRYSEAV